MTPDQYPLTLNSLTLACNQKSSREPVMSLDQGTVQHTARQLEDKHLVSSEENFKGRVVKYTQRLCNTPFARVAAVRAAVRRDLSVAVAGPSDAGRVARAQRSSARIPRQRSGRRNARSTDQPRSGSVGGAAAAHAGRRDFEYMHLFAGPLQSVAADAERPDSPAPTRVDRISGLESRVEALEQELLELKRILGSTADGSS